MADQPALSRSVLLFKSLADSLDATDLLTIYQQILLDLSTANLSVLTDEEKQMVGAIVHFIKNRWDIDIFLNQPDKARLQFGQAAQKLSDELVTGQKPSIPPNLREIVAEYLEHSEKLRQEMLSISGLEPDRFTVLQQEIERLTGSDETGRAIAFTSAVEIITEKKLSPEEISAVIGEKMSAVGLKPPSRSTVAAVTPKIITDTQNLIAAAQAVTRSRPSPTPSSSELAHPVIKPGIAPAEEVTRTMQALHAAKQKAAAPAYSARESYQQELAGSLTHLFQARRDPGHLQGKAAALTAKTLNEVIQEYIGKSSQVDMANVLDYLKKNSAARSRLEAEVFRKLGLSYLSDDQFDEAVRTAATNVLPAAFQQEGLFLTVNPSPETAPSTDFPGHALWQPALFLRWIKFQVAEFGAENLDKELQKTGQQLNTKLAAKTARVREIEEKLTTLENQLAKVPSSEEILTEKVRAEVKTLRINLADAHRAVSEAKIDQTTFEIRRRVWEGSLLLEDFDSEINRAAASGDTVLAKKIALQRTAVYRATHEQTATEVEIPMKEWQLLSADLRQAGFGEESPALKIVKELLEKKQGVVNVDQINELDRLVTEAEINQGLPRPPRLRKIRGLFDRKLPFYQQLEDARTRLQASFAPQPAFLSKIIYRVTGGRWSSVSHLLHGVYNRTLGPLAAAFKSSRLGLWLSGKAAVYSFKSLGFKAGLSTLIGKIMTKAGLSAVGAATGPVGWVATALTFVYDAGKWLIRKAKDALSYFQRKPAAALIPLGTLSLLAPPIGLPLLLLTGGLLFFTGKHPFFGSGLSGFAGNLVDFFTALLIISSGEKIAQFILILIGGIALSTLLVFIVVAAAFIIPIQPDQYATEQTYFTVSKTVSDPEIANDELPACVDYRITVSADEEIIITDITDKRTVSCKGATPHLPGQTIPVTPPSGPVSAWSSDPYQLCFPNATFEDCRVCNTVTVTADLADGSASGLEASDSVCVKIGDPPEDCPDGWPTDYGLITQGPNTDSDPYERCSSHYQDEAIDIGVRVGTLVKATFRGEVSETGYSTLGGRYVIIEGNCNGSNFSAYYYHLNTILVQAGEEVTPGYVIATSGNTGTKTTGPHLHYEFVGLTMAEPYIPETVPQSCCATGVCGAACHYEPCGVSW